MSTWNFHYLDVISDKARNDQYSCLSFLLGPIVYCLSFFFRTTYMSLRLHARPQGQMTSSCNSIPPVSSFRPGQCICMMQERRKQTGSPVCAVDNQACPLQDLTERRVQE